MPEYRAGPPFAGRRPTHPGAVLREDVLPALQLSVPAAAQKLGISRQLLHGIVAERRPITPEMALRLGKLCGDGPELWLRMQQAHDLWELRREMAKELAHIPTVRGRREAA
jgi:addiction module HigA family antidote